MTVTSIDSAAITTLRGELTQARAEIERLKRDRGELAQIIQTPHWRPAERILYASVRLQAQRVEGEQRVTPSTTIGHIARSAGLSERTVADKLEQLQNDGLLEYQVTRWGEDAGGNKIKRRSVDKSRGDKHCCEAWVRVPTELPRPLPELIEGRNTHVAKEAASEHRREFARLKAEFQAMLEHAECPHCHETGMIQIDITGICTGCGVKFDEKQLEYLARTPETSEISEILLTAKFAVYTNGAEIDEIEGADGKPCSVIVSPKLHGFPSAQEEPQTGGWGARDVLQDAETIEYLASLGAALCLTDGKVGNKPCDEWGTSLVGNYLDMPQPANVATANLKRGGGVGMLTHLSGGLTVLDIDVGLESFLAMHPELANAPRVYRDNAPGRAKLVLMASGVTGKRVAQDAENPTRKVELLHRGHANVAGKHPSGADYKLLTGELMAFTVEQIAEMIAAWIPQPYKDARASSPAVCASHQPRSTAGVGEDLIAAAIHWWNDQPANIAAVQSLLDQCKGTGKYKSVRKDDKTPSTCPISDDAWFDHGTIETIDRYEMYVKLEGIDKRTHKWSVVKDYLIATGKPDAAARIGAQR